VIFTPGTVNFNNPKYTATSTSGSLRTRLWAVDSAYGGGGLNGYVIATMPLMFTGQGDQLTNFQSAPVAAQTLTAQSPPPGSYCIVTTLEQYSTTCGSSDA
jgi:hypothetical protein